MQGGAWNVGVIRQKSECLKLFKWDITDGLNQTVRRVLVLSTRGATALDSEAIPGQEVLFVLFPDVSDAVMTFVAVT